MWTDGKEKKRKNFYHRPHGTHGRKRKRWDEEIRSVEEEVKR